VLAEAHYFENSTLKLFASRRWQQILPEADREYIAAFIEHTLSLPKNEIDQFLVNVQGISVGPLRSGANGICDELELTSLLGKVFGEAGYEARNPTT
jgi:hypothetical protein